MLARLLVPLWFVLAVSVFLVTVYLNSRLFEFDGPTFGHFSGDPVVQFVNTGPGGGRDVRLVESLVYTDPNGGEWPVPANWVTDGASIPQAFWTIVGGPLDGPYRDAAIVHDYYTDVANRPLHVWQDVHRVFYYASLANGVDVLRAKILYAAVLLGGPRWPGGSSGCHQACHGGLPENLAVAVDGAVRTLVTEEEARAVADWIETENPAEAEIVARYAAMVTDHGF